MAYNMPGVYVFEGTLKLEALTLAFNSLIERHESLRTIFIQDSQQEIRQLILSAENDFKITYRDLRDKKTSADELVRHDFRQAFDLSTGPLLRASLYQIADDRWIFTYVMHHIISDGWSMGILIRELLSLYNGTAALIPLTIQYKDYASWQQQQLNEEPHQNYWLQQLSGELPLLELPLDYPRPAQRSYQGKNIHRLLNSGICDRLRTICREQDATLFMGLLTAVTALLYRYTGQEDIIIGTPVAGREHADLEEQIGCYLNTLALRMQFKGEFSFIDLLEHTRKVSMGAYEHQVYPFDELVDELQLKYDRKRNPLFDVMIVLQNAGTASTDKLEGLTVRAYEKYENTVSKFDLSFDFTETGDEVQANIVYNSDIYSPDTVNRMADHLEQLLTQLIQQPAVPVAQTDYLSSAEKELLLLNNTITDYPREYSIAELFEQQAIATPLKTALIFEQQQLSYQELHQQSSQLAHYLKQQYHVQAGEMVGIMLDRSEKMIIAILAVLKAGAAYVPVEVDYPVSRKAFMLKDANIKTLITQMDYMMELDYYTGKVLAIDVEADLIEAMSSSFSVEQKPTDLAYVMYTSGSTGMPKGVMVENRSVVRLVKSTNYVTLTGEQTLLSTGALSFDATTFEYWSMLLNGGTLVICLKAVLLDAQLLATELAEKNVDTIWFTAGWFNQLVDTNIEIFKGLKTVLAGGDKLSPFHVNTLLRKYPEILIINGYGPTENTTFSLSYPITTEQIDIPIGKPISNSAVYIVDAMGALVPAGVTGEICTGGDGLARGYLNNPELTAEKFVPNPFVAGERMYKTGDLGKWLPDGNVAFLGRKDEQVKIRGYRIELHEIERILISHPVITDAVLIARTNQEADKELLAYFTGSEALTISEVKNYLLQQLPAYMVPAYYVQLEVLPLNTNGKVDKKQLPEPGDADVSDTHIAPRNETEQRLVAIWQEILGKEKISITDNFFDIGGHSLRATRLAGQIHKVFEVKVDLKDLFATAVLEEQAALIQKAVKTSFVSIFPAAVQKDYPLSSAQRRIWVLTQFPESNVAYNMPGVYVFEGELDIAALTSAFNSLIARHESLRTVFFQNDQQEPRQLILAANNDFQITYRDLRNEDTAADQLVRQDFVEAFDLSKGPLLRASLYQVADDRWIFTYVMHHIISDGWSMGILIRELLLFYNDEAAALNPLAIQYKDYASWQQQQLSGETLHLHKGYWLKQMSGELPVLELPTDKPRPVIKTYNGGYVNKFIDARLSEGLNTLCRQQDATLFMGLVAAVTALLYRYSGQEDIIIGSPVAGRQHADLDQQIGYYLNTLALRIGFNKTASFSDVLQQTRQLTMDAYEHQVYPFDQLVDELQTRRDISRSPLFDVMIVLQNNEFNYQSVPQTMKGLKIHSYEGAENTSSKFDLLFEFTETPTGIQSTVKYNRDLFNKETVSRLADHFEQLLAAVVEQPAIPVAETGYLSTVEKEQLLQYNNTTTDYPDEYTIAELFEQQAAATPHKTALIFEQQELTYRELDQRSSQLAQYLQQKLQVQSGDMVGIMLDRSEKMIIAILGILKAGAAYVPVEVDYPVSRKTFIIKDADIKTLITQKDYITELDYYRGNVFVIDGDNDLSSADSSSFNVKHAPADVAYVMYTSGSTGMPKGVMVENRGVVRLVKSVNYMTLTGEEILLATGAPSFDASTFEYWSMLLNGGTVIMCSREVLLDAHLLAAEIKEKKVDIIWFTAGWFNQLVDTAIEIFKGLKTVLSGGDKLSPFHVNTLLRKYPQIQIINAYGPTENTAFSSTYTITTEHAEIPIGKPVSNSTIYIVDAMEALVPAGVTGEICTGGDGLARGYLNNPELTAAKFVANPFVPGERMYKTGDLGKWLPDGNIAFLGRKDQQVKIRGFRIEPGEIERILLSHPVIADAVVIAHTNVQGDKELVAYFTGTELLTIVEVRNYLTQHLPPYMLPAYYMQLDALPLHTNGKVDKKQLPPPEDAHATDAYVAPRNETEQQLLAIWQEILAKEKISVTDNFFNLGGHSLRATRLAGQIHKVFEVKVDLKDLFVTAVLEQQATLIQKAKRTAFVSILPAAAQPDYPLSSAQRRLWVLTQFPESNVAYNMPGVYVLEGELDFEALSVAFNNLIERHESLRTIFIQDDKQEPRQLILPVRNDFQITYQDLRNEVTQANLLVKQDFIKAFDLGKGPLLRASLYQIADNRWVFTYVMHHIISDGWSMGILIKELLLLYNGEAAALTPLTIQYKDYASWQQQQLSGETLQLHKGYWLQQMSGELPVLELATDKPRPAIKTFNGAYVNKFIESRLAEGLKNLCRQQDATLFMGLLAAVTTLLHRYSGQQDIIIGTPVAGRQHADLEEQIGYYLNTLALRLRFDETATFSEILEHTREVTIDAFEHQIYPFDQLVDELQTRRDISRSPLFDVMLVLQNNESNFRTASPLMNGLKIQGYEGAENTSSKFDLLFEFSETPTGIQSIIRYNSDLFNRETILRLADHFEQLLGAILQQVPVPVAKIDYLSSVEKEQLLLNNTTTDYPREYSIAQLFEQQATATPFRTALIFEQQELSYQELDQQSSQLAHYLQQQYNVQKGEMVGIMLDRSEKMIIAILAVLKAGAAYVPVEVDYPVSRKAFMVKDAGISTLITQTDYMMELDYYSGKILAIDVEADLIEAVSSSFSIAHTPADLAYVMYTSGSTGTPKGVMVENHSVVRLVKSTNYVQLTGEQTLLSTGALSFDATTFEYWSMLLNGGTLVICSREVLLDANLLAAELEKRKVDTIWFTAGWFNQLIDTNIEIFKGLKTVLAGGDKLSPLHVNTLLRKYPEILIINGYGPTENTTFSLTYPITTEQHDIPIGKPISNTAVYIVDALGALVPIGVTGEICTGGDGLARGYLNNPALTTKKFVPNPFIPGERMYKTGDLGKWLPDGNVAFLGRKDDQVKIRGYRIELREIEACLRTYPGMMDTIVTTIFKDELELVAYMVSAEPLDTNDIREYLRQQLPVYMLPALYVQLDVLPLNANGKVDKKQLPAPADTSDAYVAPRNETEKQLLIIWQEILGKEKISVTDNFFDLGGHSLRATRLAGQIHKTFEVKVDLKDLFATAILEEQASVIQKARITSFVSILPAAAKPDYPLSSAQRRIWVLSQFPESNVAYNMPGVYAFEGELNVEAFSVAFNSLIKRHESLRTVFILDDQQEPRQLILSDNNFQITYRDLRNDEIQLLDQLIKQDFIQAFDLTNGPLLRASLYQVTDKRWIFTYAMHHIISDGWSMGILIKELLLFYNGEAAALTPLTIQYKDYASWQQQQLSGETLQLHKGYWLRQLSGELPVIELPADKPRPAIKTYNGGYVSKFIDAGLSEKLSTLCRQQDATLFMGLLAAVTALLYRYTGQEDIIIGTPVAGRQHADLENQIGYYLNTLALRLQFKGTAAFSEILEHTKQVTMDAYEHQVYPFDQLVDELQTRRDISRSPLFDVMIILQNNEFNYQSSQVMNGLKIQAYKGAENKASKFDLLFEFTETTTGIQLNINYNSDLFNRETITRISNHFEQLLEAVVDQPKQPVNVLPYLSKTEQDQLLTVFNPAHLHLSENRTVTELFEQQAAKHPDAIALVYGHTSFTYHQLNEQANQLAHYLRDNYQIKPDDLIAVRLPRDEWMLITLLAVLKAGAAYVPIDPKYPTERIDYILSDSHCKTIIDEGALEMFRGIQHLYSIENPVKINSTGDLAYVIYTSGSTGKPKGVMVEHHNVYAFIQWCISEFSSADFDIIFSATSVCFDLYIFEIFYPLSSGKKLRLLENALEITQYLQSDNKVLLNTVPSVAGTLLKQNTDLSAVTVLNMAGEPLPAQYVDQLDTDRMEVRNLYGPTEDTTYSTVYRIHKGQPVLIGKPIANTRIYILGENDQLLPVGIAGEICLSGDGVARGYLNKETLTAEKFVANPFVPGERMYRTGDLGRWLMDGNIEFLGRKDDQVKIRGYRIEPGEIENCLRKHPAINDAVVITKHNKEEAELIACFTAIKQLTIAELKGYLGQHLPAYMLPGTYVQMEALPLNTNGKVDKKQLAEYAGTDASDTYIAPRNETELQLVAIWQEILGKEKISVTDNFFDLGGHSLKATRLAGQIHKMFDVKVDLKDLFTKAVLEEQASLIQKSKRTAFVSILPAAVQSDYPLSSAQRRLWVLSQFTDSNVAYNMPGVYVFEGALNIPLLTSAFNRLINRHESLRTIFIQDNHQEPRQLILSASNDFQITYRDLRNEKAAADQLVRQDFIQPFDLGQGPLLRASLYQIADDRWIFTYVMHHIISDGWSMGILIRELLSLYNGTATLVPLAIQYKDYASWQQQQLSGENLQLHKSYWLKQMEAELPVIELPADKPRPAVKTYNGGFVNKFIDAGLAEELNTICRQQNATLFMGLVSVLTTLFYRYSGQKDIILGTPVAGRQHADLEEQIGYYLNTLALRIRMEDNASFSDILQHTKQVTMDAFEHQVYPFDQLVDELQTRRDISRSPLFDVMVILQNNELKAAPKLNGLKVHAYENGENTASKFDLLFEFTETSAGIRLNINYNTDLFNRETISRMADHYEQILTAAVAQPKQAVSLLSYISDAEREQLLVDFNADIVALADNVTIVDLFEQQDTDAIALLYGHKVLTHRHLNEQANQLAHYLRNTYNIKSDDLVAIKLPRNEWIVIAMLAVLKAGAAYVPIDPGYPQERIDYILSDAQCKIVLDDEMLEAFREVQEQYSIENLLRINTASSPAYVIYTSGSTGKPKGVMVEHHNVYAFIQWCSSEFNAADFDIIFSATSVCFDLSIFEIFYPLCTGKQFRLLENALEITQYLQSDNKVLLNTVPSVVGTLLKQNTDLSAVTVLNMAGEPLPAQYVDQLDTDRIAVRNLYGPTEDTTYSTVYRIHKGQPVLIGKPITNTRIYILGENDQLLPVSIAGEICLSGDGVARGYLNNEALTAEKFVANPFVPAERMYRTGDLGRWLADGNIEFLGRKDDQVKIRGYRIEPGEIENCLRKHPAITDTVVITKYNKEETELVACLVAIRQLTVAELKSYLGQHLPAYMLPGSYVQMEALPLNTNGKVDKKQLAEYAGMHVSDTYITPRNETEQLVLAVWQEVLGREQISITDNFFDLGGNSLSAIRLQYLLNKNAGFSFKLQDIYHYPTIAQLALNQSSDVTVLKLNNHHTHTGKNIYFIPPVFGNATLYKSLSEKLEDQFNCYGLQYRGLEKDETLYTTIGEAAEDFVQKMESADDFILIGYSMGAVIAFEMAKILEAKHRQFQLILVDRDVRTAFNNDFEDVLRDSTTKLLLEKYKRLIPGSYTDEEQLLRFLSNNVSMLNTYEQKGKISSPIHAIEASGNTIRTNMANWKIHTTGEVKVTFIDGDHWEIFTGQHLIQIESLIRSISKEESKTNPVLI